MNSPDRSARDVELIQHIARGNEEAFEELYDHYAAPIYNYLLRLTHAAPASENLLQETFLAVWRSADRFREEALVKNWIYRIAHNQAVSWLRKTRQDNLPREVPLNEIHLEDTLEINPEQLLLERVDSRLLAEALTRLSPRHRAVVELAYVHQFSYLEISRIVNCPLGTVKSRLNYALKYLLGILKTLQD